MQQGFAARVSTRRLRFAVACATALSIGVLMPATSSAHGRGARLDSDRDGLTNKYERTRSHTNPRRADTDRDGLRDRYEVKTSHTNPRRRDTDRDGLTDRYEIKKSHTDPRKNDTDGDGLSDGYEIGHRLDPLTPQAPADGGTRQPVELPLPDPLAPDTTIDSGPSGTSTSDSASFTFSSPLPLSTFNCRLDGGAWSACRSPKAYSDLGNGSHTFEVAARDVLGADDDTPASRTWTVAVPPPPDMTAPQTTITSGPSGTSTNASASFAFSSSESGSTFQCRLDGGAWSSCSSPKSYSSLANGSHTFSTRATDAAGNTDASPASRTWTVDVSSPPPADTTPPETTITSGPSGTSTNASASFAFSSSEPGSTFRCRVDGGSWASCTSPKAYSNLGNGSHTFDVAATDAAGNADATPASRTWTVDVSSPPPAGGNNCMADPSVCGYPDVETTGVTPGTPLTQVNGVVTLSQNGQVYENKIVRGSITVTGTNVTIRNVRLINTDEWYGIRVTPGGSWDRSDANLVLDHVEIDLGGRHGVKGVAFNGYTMRNTFIHNGSDCAHFGVNVTLENNLCVDGPDTNSDGWPDSTSFCTVPQPGDAGVSHFDGFQTDGGRNVLIRHNTIRNPCEQTSAILLSSNTSHVSSVTVDNNLLAGGGYSLYCAGMNDRSSVDHIVATNNRFSKWFHPRGGYWGPTAYCEFADTMSGNVWDDTGGPLN